VVGLREDVRNTGTVFFSHSWFDIWYCLLSTQVADVDELPKCACGESVFVYDDL